MFSAYAPISDIIFLTYLSMILNDPHIYIYRNEVAKTWNVLVLHLLKIEILRIATSAQYD